MHFEVLKQEEKFGLRFWMLNDRGKGMINTLSKKKLTSKLWLVYLQVKLQQKSTSAAISYKSRNKQRK